jgi:poly-gamma-glutamate synthesis protein (capsule biosynthesis protein)
MYEQSVSYAAIDAGADLILGEHAHILRGIEQYKGKTIYHGLGHFVPFDPDAKPTKRPLWMVQQQQKIFSDSFGLNLSETQDWPEDNDSRMTIIAKCVIENGKISQVGFLPCLINNKEQPEILKHNTDGQKVFDYVNEITRAAKLNAQYKWNGDEVAINY